MLVDRIHRTRLLGVATTIWAVAEAASAPVVHPAVGVEVVPRRRAAAIPAVVSLAGDYYPVADRARIFGYILAGELIGTAFGYLVAGQVGIATSWRWAYGLLAVIGGVLAVLVGRLREPERGTQPRKEAGFTGSHQRSGQHGAVDDLEDEVRDQHVPAPGAIVLDRDPAEMPVGRVVRYVLKVRSNLVLIIASALSYLFLAGVQTFTFAFAEQHLHLSSGGATLALVGVGAGAVIGVLLTGRVADRLIARGHLNARPLVAAIALGAAAVCFVPGFLVPTLWVAVPLLVIGAVGLGGSNPPLDSARLDVIHHNAWGRTEGIRGTARLAGYAVAPLLVGSLAVVVGLAWAFVVLTVALAAAALIMLVALRYYQYDVSAAIATEHLSET
jgi:MFS family permease